VSVCLLVPKILKNASSRVAKAFKDVILYKKQSTESYWNISVPDIQIKAVHFTIISATANYWEFLAPPNRMWLWSANQIRKKYRYMWDRSGNIQRGVPGK